MSDPRVLLISAPGLLGPDLMQMADAGGVTALQGMMDHGALGFVRQEEGADVTQQIWTIATGFAPDVHGVPGPYGVMPGGTGIYPIGRANSRCMPFWEVSARQGSRSCCIAWSGTRDSDETNLCVFTDDVGVAFGTERQSWPILPGTTNEPDMEAALVDLRVHPGEIMAQEIDFFVPSTTAPIIRRAMAQALAAAATVQAVALHVLGTRRFSVVAVHFDYLDRIRRLRARAPRLVPITAVAQAHRFFDLLMANLRRALTEHTTLILATTPARDRAENVVPGVLIMEGPNVRSDVLIGDVRLTDIAPAALQCIGAAVPEAWLPMPWESAWRALTPVQSCAMELVTPLDDEGSAWEQVQRLGLKPRPPLAPFRRQIESLIAKASWRSPD